MRRRGSKQHLQYQHPHHTETRVKPAASPGASSDGLGRIPMQLSNMG